MFCHECGSELSEGSAFCPKCGTQVAASPQPQPQGKRPRKRTAIVAGAIAAIVVVAGVGAGLWWKADQDAKAAEKEAWDLAHTSLVTPVPAMAPGFDSAATAIPVQVHGTDLDGNPVDETQFLRPDSLRIETLAGSYDISFPGGYLTGAGVVVKAPGTTQHLELQTPSKGDDASSPAAQSPESSSSEASDEESNQNADPALQAVEYTEVPALEVTDELVDEIVSFAEQDPDDNGKAGQLGQAAQANHQAAVAEEEARKAAEAEAARVQARKAQIEQKAEEYLYYMYDNYGERGKAIEAGKPKMVGYFTNGGTLQSGWPNTRMTSFGGVEAVSENEVKYTLTYDKTMGVGQMPPSEWKWEAADDAGTITFDANGLIDQWYPKGSPNGRLLKP